MVADYFIICSATNERQARAIANDLRVRMKGLGKPERGVEGVSDARWLLQDFNDVVVHVFQTEHRDFYDLEGLWADAPRIRWKRARVRA